MNVTMLDVNAPVSLWLAEKLRADGQYLPLPVLEANLATLRREAHARAYAARAAELAAKGRPSSVQPEAQVVEMYARGFLLAVMSPGESAACVALLNRAK